MSEYLYTPEGKDPGLWRTAHKIASFKRHMATYLIINIFYGSCGFLQITALLILVCHGLYGQHWAGE